MSIKNFLVKLAEKITGRKCCSCAHNKGGKCTHPYEGAFSNCWQSMSRPGFTPRLEGPGQEPGADLTEEEAYQLAKIQAVLQEAEKTARDGGLVDTAPPQIARLDAYWDDRAESGLLEEE